MVRGAKELNEWSEGKEWRWKGKSRLRESLLLFPPVETFLQFSQQLSKVPSADAFHSYSEIFPRLNFPLYNDPGRPRFVYCSHRKSTERSWPKVHLNRPPLPRIQPDTGRTMSILSSRRTIMNYAVPSSANSIFPSTFRKFLRSSPSIVTPFLSFLRREISYKPSYTETNLTAIPNKALAVFL